MTSNAQASTSDLPALTTEQIRNLLAFHRSGTPGETTYLDVSNPTHKAFIQTMLELGGRTPENYPNLYNALKSGKSAKTAPDLDKVHLVDAGKTASGKATASVWSRSSGNAMIKGGTLLAFNSKTGELLAQGANTTVSSGFLDCPTHPAASAPAPAGTNLSLLYLGHATDADGSTRFYSYANNAMTAEPMDGIQVNVTNPVIQHSQNTDIWIAVGRTAAYPPPSNTDYVFYEPTSNETNPYLIVPFSGNVALSGSIDLGSLTISDLSTSVFVNNGSGTTELSRASQYTTDADMIAAFSVGSSPNILQWNFPYDQKGYANTDSIVYQQTSMGNEIDSFFYFAFNNIPLQGGSTAPPFYVCSVGTPNEPSINCTQIPNLYFWWHCLAKGTLVTLEDGTQKPIEAINETFRVRTGVNGDSLAVCATVLGRHSADPANGTRKEIFRLSTANGKTITATENHVVFADAETCRKISDLLPGDPILTSDGPSTVKSNDAITHDGMFYALALGNAQEMANADFPRNQASYYANGILCGDQLAMRHYVKTSNRDLDYMLPRIKPELHADYASAVQQMR